jgi:hypothetical protein
MRQFVLDHPIGEIDFTENGRHSLTIDRSGVLHELLLETTFTITNGGGSSPTGVPYQQLAQIFKRFEILVNGRDTIWSIPGPDLAARHNYDFGRPMKGMDATVVTTTSAATTYKLYFRLPFFLPRHRRPDDTALDLRQVRAQLIIQWGSIDDIWNTPNGAALSNVTCEVTGRYHVDVPDGKVYAVRAFDSSTHAVTATSDAFGMVIQSGQSNLLFRSFQINAISDTAGVNTMLPPGNLTLHTGPRIFQKVKGPRLQARNEDYFNPSSPVDGFYLIGAEMFGEAPDWWTAADLTADLRLEADVTKVGTTDLFRINREIIRGYKLT